MFNPGGLVEYAGLASGFLPGAAKDPMGGLKDVVQ